MAASREARQAFIASLTSFMRTNSFDGADLDWEYPGAEDRGGIPADTANFVSLLKEMKTAFGKEFGTTLLTTEAVLRSQRLICSINQDSVSQYRHPIGIFDGLMSRALNLTWTG